MLIPFSRWEERWVELTLENLKRETPGSIYRTYNAFTRQGKAEIEAKVREMWAWLSPTQEEIKAVTDKVIDHLKENTLPLEPPRVRGKSRLYR